MNSGAARANPKSKSKSKSRPNARASACVVWPPNAPPQLTIFAGNKPPKDTVLELGKVRPDEQDLERYANFADISADDDTASEFANAVRDTLDGVLAKLATSRIGQAFGLSVNAYHLQRSVAPLTNAKIAAHSAKIPVFSPPGGVIDSEASAWQQPEFAGTETEDTYSACAREVFAASAQPQANAQKIHEFPALAVIAGVAAHEQITAFANGKKFGVNRYNPYGIDVRDVFEVPVVFVPNVLCTATPANNRIAAHIVPSWNEATRAISEARGKRITEFVKGAMASSVKIFVAVHCALQKTSNGNCHVAVEIV